MMTAGSLNPWVQAINNFGDSAKNMQDVLTKAEELKKNKFIRETYQNTPFPQNQPGGVETRPGSTFNTPSSTPGSGGGDGGSGSGGGQSGSDWGEYAQPIIKFFRDKGYHDSAIQGIMANGLAEGGFSTPWKQSGAVGADGRREESYGHWQFNARGELPGYQRWARENGVSNIQDSLSQAKYIDYWVNVNMPEFKTMSDANKATDTFLQRFERPKNQTSGIRYPALQRVQNFMRQPEYTRNPAAQTVQEQPSGGMALPPAGSTTSAPAVAGIRTRPGGKTIPRAQMALAPSGLRPAPQQVAFAQPGPFTTPVGGQPQMAALMDRPQAPPPPSVLQQLAMNQNQALPGASPYEEEMA